MKRTFALRQVWQKSSDPFVIVSIKLCAIYLHIDSLHRWIYCAAPPAYSINYYDVGKFVRFSNCNWCYYRVWHITFQVVTDFAGNESATNKECCKLILLHVKRASLHNIHLRLVAMCTVCKSFEITFESGIYDAKKNEEKQPFSILNIQVLWCEWH